MTDEAFDPQRVVEPGDGDYMGDVRRLFSRAAATEILRHRPYDLHPEGLAG